MPDKILFFCLDLLTSKNWMSYFNWLLKNSCSINKDLQAYTWTKISCVRVVLSWIGTVVDQKRFWFAHTKKRKPRKYRTRCFFVSANLRSLLTVLTFVYASAEKNILVTKRKERKRKRGITYGRKGLLIKIIHRERKYKIDNRTSK